MTEEGTEKPNGDQVLTGEQKRLQNLTPFGPNNPPPRTGRKPGSRNRKTIMKEFLERPAFKKLNDQQKLILGDDWNPETVLDQVLGAIACRAATTGDPTAVGQMLDSAFGKIKETVKNEHTFTRMGEVKVSPSSPSVGQQPKELAFNVGTAPGVIDGECTEVTGESADNDEAD